MINYFGIFKESHADGFRLDFVVGVEGDLMDYVKDFCVAKGGAKTSKMDVDIDESKIELYTEDELVPCQFHEFHN